MGYLKAAKRDRDPHIDVVNNLDNLAKIFQYKLAKDINS